MPQLANFSVKPHDGSFLLQFEARSGETVEIHASAEQLDAIIDALDDTLSEYEEAAFGTPDRGEIYQKPLG